MLDPKFIIENLELVKAGTQKKHLDVNNIDNFVELDKKRKEIQTELDQKRSEQNIFSKKIGQAFGEDREEMIRSVAYLKKEIQNLEQKLKSVLED